MINTSTFLLREAKAPSRAAPGQWDGEGPHRVKGKGLKHTQPQSNEEAVSVKSHSHSELLSPLAVRGPSLGPWPDASWHGPQQLLGNINLLWQQHNASLVAPAIPFGPLVGHCWPIGASLLAHRCPTVGRSAVCTEASVGDFGKHNNCWPRSFQLRDLRQIFAEKGQENQSRT